MKAKSKFDKFYKYVYIKIVCYYAIDMLFRTKKFKHKGEFHTMDCIFCKIANKSIPSNLLYEDEKMAIFKDLNPEAPIHLLAIPKKHISSLAEVTEENSDVISHIFAKISELKSFLGIENDFRIVCNCGENSGQTVMHLHFHILSGRKLKWPPG